MDVEEIKKYTKCMNFAAIKHRNQKRKDPQGTPYINHPIGVAYILTSEGGITDLDVLMAALLHDVSLINTELSYLKHFALLDCRRY